MQDIFDEELADMVAEEIVEERAKAFENLGDAVDEMLGEDKAAQEADEEGDESSAGGADEKQAAAEDEASDSKKGEKKFFQKKGDKKTAVL